MPHDAGTAFRVVSLRNRQCRGDGLPPGAAISAGDVELGTGPAGGGSLGGGGAGGGGAGGAGQSAFMQAFFDDVQDIKKAMGSIL